MSSSYRESNEKEEEEEAGDEQKKEEKEEEEEEARDRINNLNDELLHEILSFMNVKYAVRTCVLSKRWKSLWKSLPYLYFDYQTFFPFKEDPIPREGDDDDLEEDIEDREKKLVSFNNFITQLLFHRHQTNLVKLRVSTIYTMPNAFMLYELIAYAIDHNVQKLAIHWDFELDFNLPDSFYTCQSLAALYLDRLEKLPKSLSFPALRSLHFQEVWMHPNFVHPSSFSGCPNLETLKFINTLFCEDTTLYINAPRLKRLELSFEWLYDVNMIHTCKVVIDAPGLTTFQYRGYTPIVCSSNDLSSIEDAYFDIYKYKCYPHKEEDDYEKDPQYVLHFINTLK